MTSTPTTYLVGLGRKRLTFKLNCTLTKCLFYDIITSTCHAILVLFPPVFGVYFRVCIFSEAIIFVFQMSFRLTVYDIYTEELNWYKHVFLGNIFICLAGNCNKSYVLPKSGERK